MRIDQEQRQKVEHVKETQKAEALKAVYSGIKESGALEKKSKEIQFFRLQLTSKVYYFHSDVDSF